MFQPPSRACFTKAEQLRRQQEDLLSRRTTAKTKNSIATVVEDPDSSTSSDEPDFDELLDWRSKVS